VPHSATIEVLPPLIPVFLSYVLGFAYLGSDWNNHHHMLHASARVTGPSLLANPHLLFWLDTDRRIQRVLSEGADCDDR